MSALSCKSVVYLTFTDNDVIKQNSCMLMVLKARFCGTLACSHFVLIIIVCFEIV